MAARGKYEGFGGNIPCEFAALLPLGGFLRFPRAAKHDSRIVAAPREGQARCI
jgi:hypothetical protein